MPNTIDFTRADVPEFLAKIDNLAGPLGLLWVGNEFECCVSVYPELVRTSAPYDALTQAGATRGRLSDPLYHAMALMLTLDADLPQTAFRDLFTRAYAARPRVATNRSSRFLVLRNTELEYAEPARSVPLVALSKMTSIPLPALMVGICAGEIRLQFPMSPYARSYVGVHLRDALLLTGHKF